MTKARPIVSADTTLAILALAEALFVLNCTDNRIKLLTKGGQMCILTHHHFTDFNIVREAY